MLDESTYKLGSADSNFSYSKIYFGENAEQHPISKHGIKIYRDDQIIDRCIVVYKSSMK